MVIKTVWYYHRIAIEINGTEKMAEKILYYGQFIFNKGAKIIQWRKHSLQQIIQGQLHVCGNEVELLPLTMNKVDY